MSLVAPVNTTPVVVLATFVTYTLFYSSFVFLKCSHKGAPIVTTNCFQKTRKSCQSNGFYLKAPSPVHIENLHAILLLCSSVLTLPPSCNQFSNPLALLSSICCVVTASHCCRHHFYSGTVLINLISSLHTSSSPNSSLVSFLATIILKYSFDDINILPIY